MHFCRVVFATLDFFKGKNRRPSPSNQLPPPLERLEVVQRKQLKRLENRTDGHKSRLTMKSILVSIVAAVVLVGCGESKQSTSPPESKPVALVAEAAKPEPPTAKAPNISIHQAVFDGNIGAVKQHLDAGTDVNAKAYGGSTPLHRAAFDGHKEIAELLIDKGADVNAKNQENTTPLDKAIENKQPELANLLRKHGGKTGEELKAEGK